MSDSMCVAVLGAEKIGKRPIPCKDDDARIKARIEELRLNRRI